MRDKLILARRHWQAMRRHAARCAPLEACGLLAGKGDRVQAVLSLANATQSPFRFRMEPGEQLQAFNRIEARGLELIGIYHSHPAGPESPSPTDVAEAAYPVVHVVWSPQGGRWQARGFWIEDGQVFPVTLQSDYSE